MKVLYIHSNYPNYSEAFIHNEVEHLIAQGAEVQVLNLNWKANAIQSSSLKYNTRNPLKFRWGRSLIKSSDMLHESMKTRLLKQVYMRLTSVHLLDLVKSFSPEIIISHFAFSTSKVASEIAHCLGIRHYLRLHTTHTTLTKNALQTMVSRAYGGSAISQYVLNHFMSFTVHKLSLIRQDINFPELEYSYHAPSAMVKLVSVGRFIEKKGFESLISAVNLLRPEQRNNVHLTIVGRGKLANEYRQLIEKENLVETVILIDALPHRELITILKNSDMLIVPSRDTSTDEEGIPTVIPEAMAVGTPVLCSMVGALDEIIRADINAFVIEDVNPNGISESLSKVLDKKMEWKYVCEQARKDVEQYYTKRLKIEDLNIE
ncbi:MAG: glycosyltransferase family 4 protein [Bacteroidia bacterium]